MKQQLEKEKVIQLEDLLDFEPHQDGLEALENVLPAINATYDEDARRDLPEILADPEESEDLQAKFDLLLRLLETSKSIKDVAAKVDQTYQEVRERYEENMKEIFDKTKPFEKTARSLSLLYENAHGSVNVFVMPVTKSKFADAANPKHYEQMRHWLREKYYAWRMEESPFYISYVGDIGSKSAMDKMAKIAEETRAIAVLDIREMGSAKAVMDYADRIKIAGIPAPLAHLVIPGTWVYAQGAKDIEFVHDTNGKLKRVEKQMAVPSASALIGRLLEVRPGVYITGLESEALVGINGVRVVYDLQRIDAKQWDERGLIQIEPYGHVQGATTANKSNNYDLRKFPKVDTANALLKDLVQYCNNKAYSKWGEKYKRAFQREIEIYLNRRMKQELIEGYTINTINYDTYDENVEIDITVQFFEVADEFDINLHGPKGGVDVKKEEENN
jgi:Trp operon repressor